jgi:cAMP-specific phosphodiesterase 4
VLENFHVSEVFKELNKEKNNILELLAPEEYRIIRRRMIESILATDMSNHAKTLSNLKNKLETFDINKGKNLDKMIFNDNLSKTYENQQTILNMVIHTADISNPCKPASINKIWVDLLFIEYFSQGDIERSENLPVSKLCDRYSTNINESQTAFINCIVMPTFETLLKVIPEMDSYYKTMQENLRRYEELLSE